MTMLTMKRLVLLIALSLGLAGLFVEAAGAQEVTRGQTPQPAQSGPSDECLIRIGLISDPHVWLTSEPRYAVYLENFAQAIKEVNQAGVDLVLIAGDLTNSGRPEEYAKFKEMVATLQSPVLFVPGNHDAGGKVSATQGHAVAEDRLARYQALIAPNFYSAEPLSKVRVIGINASLLGSGLDMEQKQWEFLESELSSEDKTRQTILMLHYPIYSNHLEEKDTYSNVDGKYRGRLISLLERANVKLVISGHMHHPGDITTSEGIRMITAPATSFGLPFGEQPQGWLLLTFSRCDGSVKAVEFHKISDPTPPPEKN